MTAGCRGLILIGTGFWGLFSYTYKGQLVIIPAPIVQLDPEQSPAVLCMALPLKIVGKDMEAMGPQDQQEERRGKGEGAITLLSQGGSLHYLEGLGFRV